MRLIDADELMKECAKFVAPSNNSDFADVPTWNDAVSLIGSAPTIDAVPVVRCKECLYYDPPHVEKDGERFEYSDMPEDALDFVGLVSIQYGINVGGRCTRHCNYGYLEDKTVFVPEDNYCGRGERSQDHD